MYAVMTTFYCLKLKIDVLQKIMSGENNTPWIQARYNATKQMQAMMGYISVDKVKTMIPQSNKRIIVRLRNHYLNKYIKKQ